MLTQMPHATASANVASGKNSSAEAEDGQQTAAGRSQPACTSFPKTISIHGQSESLRHLLRHLTANWEAKSQACKPLARGLVDQQEH